MLNNSDKKVDVIFKTFNKSIELSEVKVDEQRGNFIIKSLPEEYAKELKKGYSAVAMDKAVI